MNLFIFLKYSEKSGDNAADSQENRKLECMQDETKVTELD